MMRLARAYDEGPQNEGSRAFARLATAITKYWVCKRNPPVVAEALECLGGAGYVEESGLPRLFRESPLNSIWEGSGNVICLDVLRALAREPESLDAVLAEISPAESGEPRLQAWMRRIRDELARPETVELRARVVVERLAIALQAALLVRSAPTPVAEAFCASRLTDARGLAFGTLPAGVATRAIVDRRRHMKDVAMVGRGRRRSRPGSARRCGGAHALRPLVLVGQAGITASVMRSVGDALAHELVRSPARTGRQARGGGRARTAHGVGAVRARGPHGDPLPPAPRAAAHRARLTRQLAGTSVMATAT
jgi:hypothetical protein